MRHLEGLNQAQREAVLHTEGPLIIVAGAGTGKTRVLTHRILHLVTLGVAPESILAITFTNKAAGEMRERVHTLLGSLIPWSQTNEPINYRTSKPFVSTFHALGVSILRDNATALGMPQRFAIFDRDDSISLIKKIQKELGMDPKEHSASAILGAMSRAKGEALTLARYREERGGDRIGRAVVAIWERYADALKREKAFDFDDLLLATLELLRSHPDILTSYRNRFSHIMVDEYQDTNIVQYELAKLLANPRNNICVVGDHDQCIYTWRSADLRNLARFEDEFPGTRVILLEENYRSTKTILTAANDAIKQNEARKDKTLYTNNHDGPAIEVFAALDESHEARWIAARTKELIKAGTRANEIAVLFRAHFQSRALEEAFLSENIPYQMIGTRFFERKEVKDVMSYLGAALNPDALTHFARIANVPARGIGKTTLLRITSGNEHELSPAHAARVANVRALLSHIREAAHTLTPSKLVEYVLKESGMETELQADGDEGAERLLNIKELSSLAGRYDALPVEEALHAFMDAVALASDQDSMAKQEASVKLMTVHAAKGLEFDHVFIAGLEEGLFPSERSEMRPTPEEREEERRLFYVALTRAKQQAHLSYASIRTVFGSTNVNLPSRFLTEIDESLVQAIGFDGAPAQSGKRELLTIDWDDL